VDLEHAWSYIERQSPTSASSDIALVAPLLSGASYRRAGTFRNTSASPLETSYIRAARALLLLAVFVETSLGALTSAAPEPTGESDTRVTSSEKLCRMTFPCPHQAERP
jgi:hypothetical protein